MNFPLLQLEQFNSLNIKLFILDPLSVIIKLAILANKPIGTKIIIKNNIIQFQDPGIFQFVFRYLNNCNKFDLHFLYNPIKIACSIFLENNQNNVHFERIKKLFLTAQIGLKNLTETYRNYSIVNVCLNYYYSMISNFLENNSNTNLFQKDNMTSLYTENLITKLKSNWTENRIKIVLDIVDFLSDDNSASNDVKALENILDNIDNETQTIVSNI